MYHCKDFMSLSVLSLYEGELIGKVEKLFFDAKLKKLLEIGILSDDGAKMNLAVKNIFNVGKNAITIKNNQSVVLKTNETELCVAPIGFKAFSINGEFLGVVNEITLTDKFATDKISLDNGNLLDVKDLASCGKNTIIFYNNANRVNIKNFMPEKTPKVFKQETETTAEILPVESKDNVVEVGAEKVKIFQNSDFLIGRICLKDIFNFNNELLIKANAVVTKKNLKEINKFGKLKELMLYSVSKSQN